MASSDNKVKLAIAGGLGCMLIVTILMLSAIYFLARPPNIEQDGGLELILQIPAPDATLLEATAEVLRARLRDVGARGSTVQLSDGRIVVQIPGEVEDFRPHELLTTVGHLEFKEVQQEGAPPGRRLDLDGHIASAHVGEDEIGLEYVAVEFDDFGREGFCSLSTAIVGRSLDIVVDGVVFSSPVVIEPICEGNAWISLPGELNQDELRFGAHELVSVFRAGTLPAPTVVWSERVILPGE